MTQIQQDLMTDLLGYEGGAGLKGYWDHKGTDKGRYSERDMQEEELFGVGAGEWGGCIWKWVSSLSNEAILTLETVHRFSINPHHLQN